MGPRWLRSLVIHHLHCISNIPYNHDAIPFLFWALLLGSSHATSLGFATIGSGCSPSQNTNIETLRSMCRLANLPRHIANLRCSLIHANRPPGLDLPDLRHLQQLLLPDLVLFVDFARKYETGGGRV
jgi:hypothetical protein